MKNGPHLTQSAGRAKRSPVKRRRPVAVAADTCTVTANALKEIDTLLIYLHEAKCNQAKATCRGVRGLYQAEIDNLALRISKAVEKIRTAA